MVTIVGLHGRGTDSRSCFFPYLKESFAEKSIDMIVPNLGWLPSMEKINQILFDIVPNPNEETYFVGHSNGNLAGVVYLNFLMQLYGEGFNIGGFYMVAPFHNVNKQAVKEATIKKIPLFGHFIYDLKVNENCDKWSSVPSYYWERVLKISKNNVCFVSDEDSFVNEQQIEFVINKLDPEIHKIEGAGHFGSRDGYMQFPVLLERILSDIESKN